MATSGAAQRLSWSLLLIGALLVASTSSEPRKRGSGRARNAPRTKFCAVFSLFNIVQFQNAGCRSTATLGSSGGNTRRNGTCYTQGECTSKGGSASGSCASGFGVCCVFYINTSGGTVTQNCSYIQNPSFPAAYPDTSSISYTIRKCTTSVCTLRLDFETFSLLGTSVASLTGFELNGGVCQDTFEISSTASQSIPVICGQNTGQHIYVDIGAASGDTVTLDFRMFSGTATNRMWDIKVTQLPCGTNYGPPDGCLQYSTGCTGRFTTFNFIPTNDNHLANQQYSHCIRQEAGFCCIQYTPCEDANSMSINNNAGMMAMVDTQCSLDYIGIVGSSAECNQGASPGDITSMYCGPFLNTVSMSVMSAPVCDCTAPFIIDVFTDNMADVAAAGMSDTVASRGTCLTWTQIPCC